MRTALLLTALLFCGCIHGQLYLHANETAVFSFNTASGKQVMLAKDKGNHYLVYRFGTKDRIEFEFPGTDSSSWKLFTYSFYFRGGGIQNAGMDLNYISFTHKGFRYVIYDTYSAEEKRSATGVKVLNLATQKEINIKGNTKTRKGSLIDFRDNGLLGIGDELFD